MFLQCCVLLLAALRFAEAASCKTPIGQDGECKPLPDCPLLGNFFKNSLTRTTGEFLKSHQCGFSGKIPKVCCPTTNLFADPSACGYSTESKIVGGENTTLDEFPWMALLIYQRGIGKIFNCGGVLISKRYVVTAAHCISKDLDSVRLGEHDVTKEIDCLNTSLGEDCAPRALDIPVEDAVKHEDYIDDINRYHDIGLIRLNQDVEISDYIKPICLPSVDEDLKKNYTGETLFVAGWGITQNETTSNTKLKVKLPVRNKDFCERTYRKFNFNLTLSEGQLCAGGEKGKDACRGDSGGPLMTTRLDKDRANQWYVAGIVSFGPTPCGMEKWGGVYTRISKYMAWITSKIRP